MTKNINSRSSGRTVAIVFVSVFGIAILISMCSTNNPQKVQLPTKATTSEGSDLPTVRTDKLYTETSANKHCSKRYPSDFAMQAACGRNAISGLKDFIDIWNRYIKNDQMTIALQQCFARYTNQNITDFAMTGACARNQENGFRELN